MIRGRVVTSLGSGLVGVRVSTSTPLEGFTLTREDGWFDLLVNGGGAVTLHFGRAPFKRSTQVVFVPWNEVSTILFLKMLCRESSTEYTFHIYLILASKYW